MWLRNAIWLLTVYQFSKNAAMACTLVFMSDCVWMWVLHAKVAQSLHGVYQFIHALVLHTWIYTEKESESVCERIYGRSRSSVIISTVNKLKSSRIKRWYRNSIGLERLLPSRRLSDATSTTLSFNIHLLATSWDVSSTTMTRLSDAPAIALLLATPWDELDDSSEEVNDDPSAWTPLAMTPGAN